MALIKSVISDVDDVAGTNARLSFDPLDVRLPMVHELFVKPISGLPSLLEGISECKRITLRLVRLLRLSILRRALVAAVI